MSPNKTLYVREEDAPLWERVEKAAQKVRQSVSTVVVAALNAYLPTIERTEQVDELTVDMRDNEGREWTEGFRGRWLIEPDDDNRYGPDAGLCYGVALTAKGAIAVYCYHVNDKRPPFLADYEDLNSAQIMLELNDVLIAQAAAELGEKRVVWRDI